MTGPVVMTLNDVDADHIVLPIPYWPGWFKVSKEIRENKYKSSKISVFQSLESRLSLHCQKLSCCGPDHHSDVQHGVWQR